MRKLEGRRGLERHPAVSFDVCLNPGMAVLSSYLIVAGDNIFLVGGVTRGEPRRHIYCPQHDDHGGRKVFAVPLFLFKEELVDHVAVRMLQYGVQGIEIVRLQVAFDGLCFRKGALSCSA